MSDSGARAAIIGDPVDHLRSPSVMRFWIEHGRMEAQYNAVHVVRDALADYLATAQQDAAWRGCNVAAPLKLDAILVADSVTDRAAAAGAANILVRTDEGLVAGNTDVGAALAVLSPLLQRDVSRGITLLGDGGAARSILVALKQLGAVGAVRIQSRDLSAATKLSVEFGIEHQPVPFDTPIGSSGLINATPLGRDGYAEVAFDLSAMPARGWVVDLVATGSETDLLKRATKWGLTRVDGVSLLVEQCAASFELLFGVKPMRAHDDALYAMLRR